MRDKRFYRNRGTIWENDKSLSLEEVEDKLNEQHKTIRNLANELKELHEICAYYEDRIKELKEENEQLKQTIKEVCELLEEEVDLFSDKATEHDINAYIELRELDNKDAYYMATATKKAIKMLKGDVE